MKLMDIDQEHLGIPDTQYDATVSMSSAEFARICRDLAVLGESVKIECSKEGVTFSADGEVGKGSVLLRQNAGQDRSRVKDENEMDEDGKLDIKPKTKREARRDPDEDDEDGQRSDVDVKPDIEGGQLKFSLHIHVANLSCRGRTSGRRRARRRGAAQEAKGGWQEGQGELTEW